MFDYQNGHQTKRDFDIFLKVNDKNESGKNSWD